MRNSSLRTLNHHHSAIWLALISVAVIWGSVTWMLLQQYVRELEHTRQETANLSSMLSNETKNTFDQVYLMLLGVQERLDSKLQGRGLDAISADLIFPAHASLTPFVSSLMMTDKHGRVLHASRPEYPAQLQLGLDKAFLSTKHHIYITRQIFHAEGNLRLIKVIKPYKSHDRHFQGYLVATIMLDYFEDHFSSTHFDHPQPVALYFNDGTLITNNTQAITKYSNFLARLPDPLLNKLATLENGASKLIQTDKPLGIPELSSYAKIQDYPLILRVGSNANETLAAWKYSAMPIIIGTLISSSLILFIAVLFQRGTSRERKLQADLLTLSANIHAMRETERAHLARELHDQLGQLLTGIKLGSLCTAMEIKAATEG